MRDSNINEEIMINQSMKVFFKSFMIVAF